MGFFSDFPPMTDVQSLSLEQCVALKLMPDIRFFDGGKGPQPVLDLPAALSRGLADLGVCGVILFRENLATLEQCRNLTAQLRHCLGPGVLIGIDQEGGRVTRLPRAESTSFSGNMALAACPPDQGVALAGSMAAAQAIELADLGININFVPSLDVNSNPDNPVIHVRAFSDDPARVAELGAAVVTGLQGGGVAAAVKHFPGHGDTCDDSHTGLPRVMRSREEAQSTDLAPFREVIASADPAMVMTAHIQYPSLDGATLDGTDIVRPATLSRPIMTDLLRGELGFAGVVITDALDMGAISQILTPTEAVLGCFAAGVDIALMPILLRSRQSLEQLQGLVDGVVAAVRAGELDESEIRRSAGRVLALQTRFAAPAVSEAVDWTGHAQLEHQIASASITLAAGEVPDLQSGSRVHLLMPGAESAEAMAAALLAVEPGLELSWQSLESFDLVRERELLAQAQHYVVGVSEPALAAVALGGAEDLNGASECSPAQLQKMLLAEAQGLQRVAIMLYSPYPALQYAPVAEAVLASYDGAPVGREGQPGPAFVALASVLCGREQARGTLPVSLR